MELYMLLCVGGICVAGGVVDLCQTQLSGSWVQAGQGGSDQSPGVQLAADRSRLRDFDISFGMGIAIAGGYLWLLPNLT